LFDYNGKNYERALAFRFAHYLANIIENNKHFGPDIMLIMNMNAIFNIQKLVLLVATPARDMNVLFQ